MDRIPEYPDCSSRGVLVPVDFTPVGEYAILHGRDIARALGCPITLLHVETTVSAPGDETTTAGRLASYTAKCALEGVEAVPLVLQGNLFSAISAAIADTRPLLMVLGTHGKQGLQHLFGSYALRVVLDASCPVLVVQAPPPAPGYGSILLPSHGGTALHTLTGLLARLPAAGPRSVCLLVADEAETETERSVQQPNAGLITALKEAGFSTVAVQSADPADLPDRVLEQIGNLPADLVATVSTPPSEVPGFGYAEWNERLMFNPFRVPVLFVPFADGQG